jgi:type IV secretory pathway VirB2 component (pilin)
MTTAAAAVIVVTGIAALFGPRLSGFVNAFSVVTMILVAFTHAQTLWCG